MSNLRQRMLNGEKLLGTMLNIVDHIDIVKILKVCGFDYFILDCEHGVMDPSRMAAIIALAKEMDIGAMVRIAECSRELVIHCMELGADGLMLPNTDTAAQARELVRHAKYSPLGNRGVSMMRGHTRYVPVPDPLAYMKQANDETILIVQVESPESVANIDEILAVDGIDVAFIGPNDLCHSLGVTGNQQSPVYLEAVEKVIAAARRHGKVSGIQMMNVPALQHWIDRGARFNLYSNEVNMMMNDAKAALKQLRG